MGRRFHFPFLFDVRVTSEPTEIRALGDHPQLDRSFRARGPLVNRLLCHCIRTVMSIRGARLPSIAPRADAARASIQLELRQRLDDLARQEHPCDAATLEALADAVREVPGTPPIPLLAQQLVGRIFRASYVADHETLAAAQILDATLNLRNPISYLAHKWSGRLARAQNILSDRVDCQPAGVHATGVAVHNLTRGLERMRDLWRDPTVRAQWPIKAVVQTCIVAPSAVVRQAGDTTPDTAGEFPPGALVIFGLDSSRWRSRAPDLAFMEQAWSHCPAATFVPALLTAVRKTALAAAAKDDAATAAAARRPATEQPMERYHGGSAEAERAAFEQLAREMVCLQARRARRGSGTIVRAAHAMQLLAVADARLEFAADMAADLRTGYAQPGKTYPAIVRFSRHDASPRASRGGLCGLALRVTVSDTESHDLLLANAPALHVRDARQFVSFARAETGGPLQRLIGLARLAAEFGPAETARMLRTAATIRRRQVPGLRHETFWSGCPIRWGRDRAVRYLLRPLDKSAAGAAPDNGADLRFGIADSLRRGDVAFELCVQPFRDAALTPIEDASMEWSETASPPIPIATLTLPRQDVDGAEGRAAERRIDLIAFNPWHTTEDFQPLGNLSRARKLVYMASSAHRLSLAFHTAIPFRNRVIDALLGAGFRVLNRYLPWHRLGLLVGLLNLASIRNTLRQHNLIDTGLREGAPTPMPVPCPTPEEFRSARTLDGTFNDLSSPRMGASGTTFGRNMKPAYCPELMDTPNPVLVSDALLNRTAFIPAPTLNLLAAAWIQFQVHDWVHHARYPLGERDVAVPLPDGKRWRNHVKRGEEPVMLFGDNVAAEQGDVAPGWPPILFANQATHWWDASEVYGGDAEQARSLREKIECGGACREGARLRLTDGYLPEDANGMQLTGFNESWWLGLSAMHTLFAREHNTVCEALRAEYPNLTDERIYQTARLVVSALIAKIHTIEWTPSILATRMLEVGLKANWFGPDKDLFARLALWLVDANALHGIPQTKPDHHAAPYSLTEEFVTVYRMHQLIPDDYLLFNHKDGALLGRFGFRKIQGRETDAVLRSTRLENVLYSFGIAHPGAITLHNFPTSLRTFERETGEIIDLAVVDLVRTRRRGIPRYNDFRAALHKPRVRRWEDLTENPQSVRRLKDIYKDIDRVDTVVGLSAETPPEGFGFSDTAFRIFILMASRRLQSDRFLTVDFRPEIYTPLGMDWVARNSMTSVILRHCPELYRFIPRVGSAFAPWRAVGS